MSESSPLDYFYREQNWRVAINSKQKGSRIWEERLVIEREPSDADEEISFFFEVFGAYPPVEVVEIAIEAEIPEQFEATLTRLETGAVVARVMWDYDAVNACVEHKKTLVSQRFVVEVDIEPEEDIDSLDIGELFDSGRARVIEELR